MSLVSDLVSKIAALVNWQPSVTGWGAAFLAFLNSLGTTMSNLHAEVTNRAPLAHGHDGSTGTVALVVCTSTTRPANLTLGMIISETDTGLAYKCTSTDPVVWAPLGTIDTLLSDTGTAINTYVLTPSPAKTAYSADDTYFFRPRGGDSTRVGGVASSRLGTISGGTSVTLTTGTTTGLATGMTVTGSGISAGTTITVTGLTTFTLSQAATNASGIAMTFTKSVTATIASNTSFALTSGTTANILPGMPISGSGIPAGCLVATVVDSTHFTSSLSCTGGSGVAVTVTVPVVEVVLTAGSTAGLSVGWQAEGSLIVRNTTISSVVDSTHILLSAVPAAGTGQVMTFNSGRNTGACAVNVSGLGAKGIKLADGTNPLSGQIRAGGVYMLKYDGTNMVLLNPSLPSGLVGSTTYGGAGTFTWTQGVDCPSWVTRIYSEVWGGGGGGGSGATSYGGGGGGGAGYSCKWVPVTPGQQITVTVGAAGAAGSGGSGGTGGTSSTGSYHSATGGAGGAQGTGIPAAGGAAGAGISGDINVAGGAGQANNGSPAGYGGAGANGGAGGAPWVAPGNGLPGAAPGGGGGAGNSNYYQGGAGALGQVRIQW
ncbi:MAG: hypothetical protein HY794_13270 [Desulfarculus sp.]|nr:hypothetical protein [Desulfarculus sp.]